WIIGFHYELFDKLVNEVHITRLEIVLTNQRGCGVAQKERDHFIFEGIPVLPVVDVVDSFDVESESETKTISSRNNRVYDNDYSFGVGHSLQPVSNAFALNSQLCNLFQLA